MSRPDQWWQRAACRGMDVELFTLSESSLPGSAKRALAVCDRCPVRRQCRDDMLQVRPSGPHSIIAGGWRWDVRGHAKPHRDDIAVAGELVDAARRTWDRRSSRFRRVERRVAA